jgi:hypothetical protein
MYQSRAPALRGFLRRGDQVLLLPAFATPPPEPPHEGLDMGLRSARGGHTSASAPVAQEPHDLAPYLYITDADGQTNPNGIPLQ